VGDSFDRQYKEFHNWIQSSHHLHVDLNKCFIMPEGEIQLMRYIRAESTLTLGAPVIDMKKYTNLIRSSFI
jgi:hypothetical protein